MNYEKKYKEALEKARQFSEHPLEEDSSSIVEYIFPELKESEDEKIRKGLICGMNALKKQKTETFATIPIDDAIAWLEKQGEKKSAEEVLKIRQEVYQSGYNDGYKHGIEDVKQGEQEPIEWKDSDEKYLFWALLSIQKDIAASEINGVNTKDLNECVKWLYSLKQRIKGE